MTTPPMTEAQRIAEGLSGHSIQCAMCGGHGLTRNADECRDCGGSGRNWLYPGGAIARYYRGPLIGKLPVRAVLQGEGL